VQAEYFEPGPEDLNFMTSKAYETGGPIPEFPLPPSIAVLGRDSLPDSSPERAIG
jgi:hypothetical protein